MIELTFSSECFTAMIEAVDMKIFSFCINLTHKDALVTWKTEPLCLFIQDSVFLELT